MGRYRGINPIIRITCTKKIAKTKKLYIITNTYNNNKTSSACLLVSQGEIQAFSSH